VRFLLRPGWLAFIALVVGFAVICYTLLAPWQFGREEQRQAQERAIAAANAAPPVPLADLAPAGTAVGSDVEWRRVTATGTYLPEAEAVVRLRVVDGKPAVEVLTPLRLDDGRIVVVDRGWVAVENGQQTPAYPPPPAGTVTVAARLHADQADPAHRPVVRGEGPPQLYAVDSRVLGTTTGLDLAGGYLQLEDGAPGVLGPLPVTPSVGGTAPFTNFSYALQWLTFGLIALVALGYFIRLEVLQRRGLRDRRGARADLRRALAGDDPEDPGCPRGAVSTTSPTCSRPSGRGCARCATGAGSRSPSCTRRPASR
jgi:cytochrome oxidase assembly protein ShyY1